MVAVNTVLNKIKYNDCWLSDGSLDYGATGGNDCSYTQVQLENQKFDWKQSAGKANISLKRAGTLGTPVRLIQRHKESGKFWYEYRGLYRVTKIEYAKAGMLQSSQKFENCQNPKCQRKWKGRTGKCEIEAHYWQKPMTVIRFQLKPYIN